MPHGAADAIPNVLFAIASVTAGTFDLDLDITEDVDVTPNYSAAYHTLVAISMALAPTPPPLRQTQSVLDGVTGGLSVGGNLLGGF